MSSSERSSGWLQGLVCLALAVVLWWVGQTWHEDRQVWVGQASSARRLLTHHGAESAESLEMQRRVSAARRQALVSRLGSGVSQEMARAELVYDVRQRCYEIKLNCQIRLTDALAPAVVPASDQQPTGPDKSGSDLLAELGIQRVRAVVTGGLSGQDAAALAAIFQQDPQHQWKINRIQFKGRAFEMDVERLLMGTGD